MNLVSAIAPTAGPATDDAQQRARTPIATQSLVARIDHHARRDRAEWWFPHQNLRMTVGELDRRARACARMLAGQGVVRGRRVGLALTNSPIYVALLIALWRLNAVPVPLRPYGGRGGGYERYLAAAEAACALHSLIHDAAGVDTVFENWRARSGKPVVHAGVFENAPEGRPARGIDPARPDEIALLQLTSGTSNDPKAVIVTHAMMMRQLHYLSDCQAYHAGRRLYSSASWLPIYHDMGLFAGVLLPLFEGCRNLLAPPYYYMRNPRRWFTLLGRVGADMNSGTNASVAAACDALARPRDASDIDLSKLHLYLGAEKVTATVLRRAHETLGRFGLRPEHLHVCYGMAENALVATRSPRGVIRQETVIIGRDDAVTLAEPDAVGAQTVVSVGRPLDGYDVSIRDARGQRLAELRLGNVRVAGPCVTPGYFRNPEATRRLIPDRTLRTGDLGFMLDGELFFVGRRDDLINIGGRKLVPEDVEQTAENLSFTGPGRTCLLGIEDPRRGVQYPLLLVESARDLCSATAMERVARIRDALLDRHDLLIPGILFCAKGAVEKTSSGKKRRNAIKLRYLSGRIELTHEHAYAAAV